ncbi:MAG: hypothetical protein RI985_164 [Chloroflexota bacterium]|jgi:competence protein ComEC
MHPFIIALIIGWLCGLVIYEHVAFSWMLVTLLILLLKWPTYRQYVVVCCVLCLCGYIRMNQHAQVTMPDEHQLTNTRVIVRDHKNTWKHQQIIVTDAHNQHYLAKISLQPQYPRGSTLILDASIKPWEHPLTSYHQQLSRQRVVGELYDVEVIQQLNTWSVIVSLEHARRYFWAEIHAMFPEPIASVVAGMLLGISGDVDQTTAEAFRRSGTSHILVISGWNITIVAALCLAVINTLKPSRSISLVIPLIVIALYVVFTGASAAVIRAGVMGGILVIGRWLDRPRSMLNIIAVAILLITMVDPAALWDVGMQLSTLATIGLVGFATPIEHFLTQTILKSARLSWAREGLASTIAAQITTLPIMACRLELPTIWSLLANTIITPVVPLAMAVGTVFLVATVIHPGLAQLTAWIAYPSFAWIVTGSQVLATWPSWMLPQIALSATWIEVCLHTSWILGWVVWQRHHVNATRHTPTL